MIAIPSMTLPNLSALSGWARVIVALVWFVFGLVLKVLRAAPRHERIVARVLGPRGAAVMTMLIGLGETAIGVWMLSGLWLPGCALLQTVLLVTMNAIELRKARDLLVAPLPMVAANTMLIGLAWYAALAR